MSKNCPDCQTDLAVDQFNRDAHRRDGLSYACRACMAVRSKRYRKYDPAKRRKYNLRDQYNLTVEQYDKIFLAQGNACAICGTTERKMCVDHDHQTGAVRGILCYTCNMALGLFGDDPEKLAAAQAYILIPLDAEEFE
jgi:Recombination endonuclease VII